MKKSCLAVMVGFFIACSLSAHADQAPEDVFKAIVKVKAVIPKDARSASSLGTEREGSGVLIDSKGHILTIGYLVNEAETIEVFGSDEKAFSATLVGYDQNTGFGLLRVDKPLGVEPVKLGDASNLKAGDPVLVAGFGGADAVQGGAVISRKEFAG